MRGLGASVIGAGAAAVLAAGVITIVVRGAIPSEYEHNVNGKVTVDGTVKVEVTVRTPDLGNLKPIPERIVIQLPEGFTLRLPDSTQTVDVKAPTDFTVREAR